MKSDAYLRPLHCGPLHRSMKSDADLRPLHGLKRVQRQPDQLLCSLYGHFAYGTCYYGHYIITARLQCNKYTTREKCCTNTAQIQFKEAQIKVQIQHVPLYYLITHTPHTIHCTREKLKQFLPTYNRPCCSTYETKHITSQWGKSGHANPNERKN